MNTWMHFLFFSLFLIGRNALRVAYHLMPYNDRFWIQIPALALKRCGCVVRPPKNWCVLTCACEPRSGRATQKKRRNPHLGINICTYQIHKQIHTNIQRMKYHSISHQYKQMCSPHYCQHHLVPLNKRNTQSSSLRILFIFIQGSLLLGNWKKLYYVNFVLDEQYIESTQLVRTTF